MLILCGSATYTHQTQSQSYAIHGRNWSWVNKSFFGNLLRIPVSRLIYIVAALVVVNAHIRRDTIGIFAWSLDGDMFYLDFINTFR